MDRERFAHDKDGPKRHLLGPNAQIKNYSMSSRACGQLKFGSQLIKCMVKAS